MVYSTFPADADKKLVQQQTGCNITWIDSDPLADLEIADDYLKACQCNTAVLYYGPVYAPHTEKSVYWRIKYNDLISKARNIIFEEENEENEIYAYFR